MDTFKPTQHSLDSYYFALTFHLNEFVGFSLPRSSHLAAIRFLAIVPIKNALSTRTRIEYIRMSSVDMSKHTQKKNNLFFPILAFSLLCGIVKKYVTLWNFRNGNGHRHKARNDHNKEMLVVMFNKFVECTTVTPYSIICHGSVGKKTQIRPSRTRNCPWTNTLTASSILYFQPPENNQFI